MEDNLQIAHIDYSINTKSLDIFTIGCNGNCDGCFNKELKDWNQKGMSVYDVLNKIMELNHKYDILIDKIILVGGDPYDAYEKYPFDLKNLIKGIKGITHKPIFLFTRYSFEYIADDLKDLVDYIKTGKYIPELKCDDNIEYGIKLATTNQRIYKKEGGQWIK